MLEAVFVMSATAFPSFVQRSVKIVLTTAVVSTAMAAR